MFGIRKYMFISFFQRLFGIKKKKVPKTSTIELLPVFDINQ